MNTNTYIIGGIVAVAILAAAFVLFTDTTQPVPAGKYDSFASCIKDSGTTFYGAFWCPHCQAQKAMFGTAAKNLPYVECSTPDGNAQLQVCKDADVSSYPTWQFPDGSREVGEVPLAKLAEKTGCALPE